MITVSSFESQRHKVEPSKEETVIIQVSNEGRTASATEVHAMEEKPATMETTDDVILHGKNTSIRHGEICARKVINEVEGWGIGCTQCNYGDGYAADGSSSKR